MLTDIKFGIIMGRPSQPNLQSLLRLSIKASIKTSMYNLGLAGAEGSRKRGKKARWAQREGYLLGEMDPERADSLGELIPGKGPLAGRELLARRGRPRREPFAKASWAQRGHSRGESRLARQEGSRGESSLPRDDALVERQFGERPSAASVFGQGPVQLESGLPF
ncbi:hypothetical protein KSP39_PZI002869 [Platanthera zijinensis]|uniref:Uncharacterized protein n=1 Tax=Platanthera zijinensis TaxID=2320716 RepID=A0AAP0GEE0_9ASPA